MFRFDHNFQDKVTLQNTSVCHIVKLLYPMTRGKSFGGMVISIAQRDGSGFIYLFGAPGSVSCFVGPQTGELTFVLQFVLGGWTTKGAAIFFNVIFIHGRFFVQRCQNAFNDHNRRRNECCSACSNNRASTI